MTVNTRQVAGRRQLKFSNFDEVLADAEHAAAEHYQPLGNWSMGQIFAHLATTFNATIDGFPMRAPWIIRFVAQTFFRRRLIYGPMSPGFKLPSKAAQSFVPGPTSTEEGLQRLRTAVARLKTETHRAPSPVFGAMTHEESDTLQLRHSEMHLSFLAPESIE